MGLLQGFFDWIFCVEKPGGAFSSPINMTEFFGKEKEKEFVKKAGSSIYRPKSFDEYVGQEKAKSILKSYIQALQERGKVFPHLLIHGKAGCGKTTLARIIANEFGKDIDEVITSKVREFKTLFKSFNAIEGGMVFLDEIHGIPRDLVEQIYTIMEDFIHGNESIEPFTLVGATTELGEILKDRKPFYDRFKIVIELEDYTVEDLTEIIKQYRLHMFFGDTLDDSVYETIARNCRETPRTALRYLESTIYLNGDVKQVLDNFNILKDGFTARDLKTLEYIAQNEKGVGLQGLAAYLGISEQNYSYEIEPYLLKKGLIMRTPRGRKIAEKGLEKIEELKNE